MKQPAVAPGQQEPLARGHQRGLLNGDVDHEAEDQAGVEDDPQRALNGGATVLTPPGFLLRSFFLPFLFFIVLECKIQQPDSEFEVETSSGFRV